MPWGGVSATASISDNPFPGMGLNKGYRPLRNSYQAHDRQGLPEKRFPAPNSGRVDHFALVAGAFVG
jgi:hypothetical protein